jgi:ABC-type dipeptide/oligopeptide/nickel transport system ATPase component
MKIALIGAPGSGKSELADALTQKLDGSVAIIDDYVEAIARDESGLCTGICASYISNLYILLGRYARERKVQDKADHSITCGTMIETAVYATLNAVKGQREADWVRVTNLMGIFGSFKNDTYDYDHVFLLPLENPQEGTAAEKVDKNLFMSVNAFGYHYTPLTGPLDERLEKALKIIEGSEAVQSELEVETPQ